MLYTPRFLQKQISAILYVEYLKSGIPQTVATELIKKSSKSIFKLTNSIQYDDSISEEAKADILSLVKNILVEDKVSKEITNNVLDTAVNVLLNNKIQTENTRKIFRSSSGKFQSARQFAEHAKTLRDSRGKFQSKDDFIRENTGSNLRDAKGKFTSVTSLANLLQARLHDEIKENMQSPALVYRTGRFARSVEVKTLKYNSRDDSLKAFLTYMKYPYQTFEPGFAQGSQSRNPKPLIAESAKRVATLLTRSRLQVVIV